MSASVRAATEMLRDVPVGDDDAELKDELTVECCHRSFPAVYYLQLDSHTA